MNAPFIPPSFLRLHFQAIEAKYALKIVGMLPRGFASHVEAKDALDLLVEKREGLSYFGLSAAELELGEKLGRPVGMVLRSELGAGELQQVESSLQPV